jgi:DNA-binding Lrp family transcriptional regulator
MVELSSRERALLDRFQRDVPVCEAPYAAMARALHTSEDDVLATLRRLVDAGVVSRVGPIFRTGSLGASTLAAMAVPAARLGEVARLVSEHRGVNHNYAREHRFNLWFVAHAPDAGSLAALLRTIENDTSLSTISLPLVREYHVDLGFGLDKTTARPRQVVPEATPVIDDDEASRVAHVLEDGLPLVSQPYAMVAARAGMHDAHGARRACGHLREWIANGAVKRNGAIVHHRRLGYVANLMAVWDIPVDEIDDVGTALAVEPAVTLCYRRAPALPAWRYNLFCMLHGLERRAVEADADSLVARHGLGRYPRARLFSTAVYKQTAAHREATVAHG